MYCFVFGVELHQRRRGALAPRRLWWISIDRYSTRLANRGGVGYTSCFSERFEWHLVHEYNHESELVIRDLRSWESFFIMISTELFFITMLTYFTFTLTVSNRLGCASDRVFNFPRVDSPQLDFKTFAYVGRVSYKQVCASMSTRLDVPWRAPRQSHCHGTQGKTWRRNM